jgi:hypothetical protein
MSLFSDLPPDDGPKTVGEAVKRLREKLTGLRGPGRHSLCEVCPDKVDYQWLCQWAAHLSCQTVSLTHWQTGALALFLAAEAVGAAGRVAGVVAPRPPLAPRCFLFVFPLLVRQAAAPSRQMARGLGAL